MGVSRCVRTCLLAAVVAAAVVTPSANAQAPPVKRVLIIHGGPEVYPGTATFEGAIRQVLFAHPTLQVEAYSEHFENEEFGDAVAESSLRELIRIKYHDHPPDVVVVNAAPALLFALHNRDALFPGVPLLFAAATPPAALIQGQIANATGIVREPSQSETLEMALKIHPGTKRFHVMAFAAAVSGYQERVKSALAALATRVTITYANEPSVPEMLATLKALPADSLIIYFRYSPMTKGRVIFPDELLPEIAAAAPVPIYSAIETNIGKGVVGGMMRSATGDATRLGEMAIRILEGATAQSIPIESSGLSPIFDWRQLQRWGIAESSLPPDADIRFRVPTVWELYGSYIFAAVVVVLAQLLLIAGLLRQRARLRSADNTIRAREASLRTSYDRIRQMAGRLINAQETARADIARDLHDDVSQKLAYASIGVTSLRGATGDIQDPQTQQAFEELDRDMRSTFEGIRRLSHDLHPATLRLAGLVPALRSHCNEVAKRQDVQVQFSSRDVGSVAPEVALCFFRITQESLRNGIVHGGAKQLTVTLTRSNNQLELIITDNGQGFDVSAAESKGGGLGLVTMEERVNLVGGEVSVVSAAGRGTTVRVSAPADPALADEAGDSEEKVAG